MSIQKCWSEFEQKIVVWVHTLAMRYWLMWMVGVLSVSSSLIDVSILAFLVFLLLLVVIDALTVQPTFEWLWCNLVQ